MLDSHCHLDRYDNAQEVAAQSAGRGVFTIAVTNLPSHFRQGLPYARQLPKLRLALGLHPLAASQHEAEIGEFERCFPLTSFIGEVGLDFSPEGKATKDRQLESFYRVAQLVSSSPKFVSVHSRRAETELLDILTSHNVTGVVFHWYSGSLSVLERLISEGHLLSVNPAMIDSAKGREIIKRIPRDRLLTESDGPFVEIERVPIRPWHVELVEKHVAELWRVPVIEVRAQIWNNFTRLVVL